MTLKTVEKTRDVLFEEHMIGPCPDCTAPSDSRIIPCEHCGSEGRIYCGHPLDPHPSDCGPCPVCEGTGGEIIETESVTLDDLDRKGGTDDEQPGEK